MHPVWRPRAEPVQGSEVSAAKILIVDDDPALRTLVAFALQRAGFATAEAADGRAALARFESEAPNLVVLDVTMPGPDGLERAS